MSDLMTMFVEDVRTAIDGAFETQRALWVETRDDVALEDPLDDVRTCLMRLECYVAVRGAFDAWLAAPSMKGLAAVWAALERQEIGPPLDTDDDA